jgi:hypothetical protein
MPNDRVTKRRTAFVQLTFTEKQGPAGGGVMPGGYFDESTLQAVLRDAIKDDHFTSVWISDVKVVLLSEGEVNG